MPLRKKINDEIDETMKSILAQMRKSGTPSADTQMKLAQAVQNLANAKRADI